MLLLVVAFAAGLSGCSAFNDDKGLFVNRSDDYLVAKESRKLIIPEDLESDRVADPDPIPEIETQPNPVFFPDQPPLPDAIYGDDNRQEVRIQKLGDRVWLVIPEPPTIVWPKLKQFLAENGVATVYEAPPDGRIDTDWLVIEDRSYRDVVRTILHDERTNAGVTSGQDRLLVKVEQGLRERTTEVHVRHENDALGSPVASGTSELRTVRSDLHPVESEMLSEFGAYIAAKVTEQTISRVAQDIASRPKAEMRRDVQGHPVLRLNLDRERAWAAVGQALANAEAEVLSRDPDSGSYSISISDRTFTGEEEPGFFSRLWPGGEAKGYTLLIQVDTLAEDIQQVTVLESPDQLAENELSQRVLVLIREYAS
ncbi:MAG: outer membrane protein assembly factor BamC [Proteobacteria bacterium]|nr:outer membrane protein assembly factor BamC [Pseudomonadota bacterium]